MSSLRRTTLGVTLLLAFIAAPLVAADGAKGSFHYGKIRFTPIDAFAFQQTNDGGPTTVVAVTNFKIDRPAVLAEINTVGAFIGQAAKMEKGAFVMITLMPGKCGVAGFLNETQQQIDLGSSFAAKTTTATASRVTGDCRTTTPGKMFDDAYDFQLSYDVPVTVIPTPSTLATGGGEPGKVYSSLIKAIQAADWTAAHTHLRADEVPQERPTAVNMKDYFESVSLNYPRTVTVTGGLMKGDRANLDIRGIDHDGKKIKGIVALKKVGGEWHVIEQSLYFME